VNEFDQIVKRHLELKAQVGQDPAGMNMAEIQSLLDETREAGRTVVAVEEREHLRAILRYWGAFIYERTSEYPATHLAPYGGQDGGTVSADGEPVDGPTLAPAAPVPAAPAASTWEGTAPMEVARPRLEARPGRMANPLLWLLIAALVVIGLIVVAVLALIPASGVQTPGPSGGEATGIPPEILEPIPENGGSVVVDVTRPPETASDVDFILTVRPEATLQELAVDLGTSLETLQALNPSLSTLPLGGTLLIPVGEMVSDARLVITGSRAAVFDQPTQQGQVLAELVGGTFATVLGRTSDYGWYWANTGQNRGWLAGQDVGLIYPTVPDGLPIIARVQIVAEDDD
jgi:hypothetical protein